jgi:hypothetical protein
MTPPDSSASDATDSKPSPSLEVETPRGGFMARPGLKAPPRHAVVVRTGDAPEDPHIPVARSSLPPPPSSLPPPSSEAVTRRALPALRVPQLEQLLPPPPEPHSWVSPLPPLSAVPTATVLFQASSLPSDAPTVATIDEQAPEKTYGRAPLSRPWLSIVAAALAGLLIGIASVVTTVHIREASLAASKVQVLEPGALGARAAALPLAPASSAVSIASSVAAPRAPRKAGQEQSQAEGAVGGDGKASGVGAQAPKRTIF